MKHHEKGEREWQVIPALVFDYQVFALCYVLLAEFEDDKMLIYNGLCIIEGRSKGLASRKEQVL